MYKYSELMAKSYSQHVTIKRLVCFNRILLTLTLTELGLLLVSCWCK